MSYFIDTVWLFHAICHRRFAARMVTRRRTEADRMGSRIFEPFWETVPWSRGPRDVDWFYLIFTFVSHQEISSESWSTLALISGMAVCCLMHNAVHERSAVASVLTHEAHEAVGHGASPYDSWHQTLQALVLDQNLDWKRTPVCHLYFHVPVVPHKAVAEVSRIGNL